MSRSPEAPPPRSAVPPEETEGPVVTRPSAPPPPPFPIPPLFGKYSFEGLEVHDPGLAPYLYLHPIYAPHTEGKLSGHPFQKTRMHLVERLTNHLMKGEHFTGKKSKALATVRKAFDELSQREKQNPLQLLINAVENAAPREEVTRLQFGGAIQASHKSTKSIESCLANEIALAAKGDQTSFAVARKEEVERVAQSAR
ncbi:MAG: 30S ribosomal protein S7 [Thermoplasmatales archaeon]|nr:30S ribosomal protein S7 [Thermoplasmatales archaeon]